MMANIADNNCDGLQAQKQVELWTPWGVLHVTRDDDTATRLRKRQAGRRLPAAAMPAVGKPDVTPRA